MGRGSSPRMRGTHGQHRTSRVRVRIIPAHAGNTRGPSKPRVAQPDHPRACGEHHSSRRGRNWRGGSSPRMRGTLEGWTCCVEQGADHPRACGEHLRRDLVVPTYGGSSPRMRGTREDFLHRTRNARIIPAHAGNTLICPPTARPRSDHPRACGEHKKEVTDEKGKVGSSPRMRGTPPLGQDLSAGRRIIPAHAGNTPPAPRPDQSDTDHPRACGEHFPPGRRFPMLFGSSPRMRGTRRPGLPGTILGRIIPAHAGNTTASRCCCPKAPDHPRACGEHLFSRNKLLTLRGSSPRMRGTPAPPGLAWNEERIIPAHAGNTSRPPRLNGPGPDHPRACGEHSNRRHLRGRKYGSSPRMRGTLCLWVL